MRLWLRRLRKLEAESDFFRPLLAIFHIFEKLLTIPGNHVWVLMPHPIINQKVPSIGRK